jgi:hypothetical protein
MKYLRYFWYSALVSLKNRIFTFCFVQESVWLVTDFYLNIFFLISMNYWFFLRTFPIEWKQLKCSDHFHYTNFSSHKSTQIYGLKPHKSQWPIKYTNFVWFFTIGDKRADDQRLMILTFFENEKKNKNDDTKTKTVPGVNFDIAYLSPSP